MSAAQQAMDTLTAQWYNATTRGLELDPATFQLIQANQSLGTSTNALWDIFDSVPPDTVSHYYNPAQSNRFSSNYRSIMASLNPVDISRFKSTLGTQYDAWTEYLKSNPPTEWTSEGYLNAFKPWAFQNLSPGKVAQATTAYKQITLQPLYIGVEMISNLDPTGAAVYSTTIDAVNGLVEHAPSKAYSMNSSTESSNTTNTWAKGSVGGAFDWFSGSASASYDKMTTQIATAGVEIAVKYAHIATITAGPLSHKYTEKGLENAIPWFYSSAYSLAYKHKQAWAGDAEVTWDDEFGVAGLMLREATSMIVVDGIDITITSKVGFSKDEQESYQAAAKVGVWPFFSAEGSGGSTDKTTFDDNGNMTITSTSPEKNPAVIGMIVTPTSALY